MMVSPPHVERQISPAPEFQTTGPLANRAVACVERLVESGNLPSLPAGKIEILSVPPHHSGLGVGTQFNLAITAGLNQFLQQVELTPAELAQAASRGQRSAVGTYGFLRGGLIVDAGKLADQPLGVLSQRLSVPDNWRIVLIRTLTASGLSDETEKQAFAELPPVPTSTTARLWKIVKTKMCPTLAAKDCSGFGESVYEYGRL
ncbi:MAG: hypothetical protein MJA83_13280, partial [Gammaproteobacteria bacterium]|nr:hypothetical protein [Gammaproteobacteria bacterium]